MINGNYFNSSYKVLLVAKKNKEFSKTNHDLTKVNHFSGLIKASKLVIMIFYRLLISLTYI